MHISLPLSLSHTALGSTAALAFSLTAPVLCVCMCLNCICAPFDVYRKIIGFFFRRRRRRCCCCFAVCMCILTVPLHTQSNLGYVKVSLFERKIKFYFVICCIVLDFGDRATFTFCIECLKCRRRWIFLHASNVINSFYAEKWKERKKIRCIDDILIIGLVKSRLRKKVIKSTPCMWNGHKCWNTHSEWAVWAFSSGSSGMGLVLFFDWEMTCHLKFFIRCKRKNCVRNESARARAGEQKKERMRTRAPMIKHVYRARKPFFPICWHTYSLRVAAKNKAIKRSHTKFHMCFCPFSFSLTLFLVRVHSAPQFMGLWCADVTFTTCKTAEIRL